MVKEKDDVISNECCATTLLCDSSYAVEHVLLSECCGRTITLGECAFVISACEYPLSQRVL